MPFFAPLLDIIPNAWDIDILGVAIDLILTEQEFDTFNSGTTITKGRGRHAVLREFVTFQDRPSEVYGVIGVHDIRATPSFEPSRDDAFTLHVGVQLRKRGTGQETQDQQWVEVVSALPPLLSGHELNVECYGRVADEGISLAVSLPIELDGSGVAGFTHITGVRLEQRVESEHAMALERSAVVQQLDGAVGLMVSTTVAPPFGPTLLARAADRAMTLGRLAVPSLPLAAAPQP